MTPIEGFDHILTQIKILFDQVNSLKAHFKIIVQIQMTPVRRLSDHLSQTLTIYPLVYPLVSLPPFKSVSIDRWIVQMKVHFWPILKTGTIMRPDQSIINPISNTFDNLIDVWPWNIGSDPLWVWLRPQISGHKVTSSSILSFKGQGSNPNVIIFLVFNQVIKSWASTNMIWDK